MGWVKDAESGQWTQLPQMQHTDEAARQAVVPEPKWYKNRETGEWEQWVEDAESGQWTQLQQVQHTDEAARQAAVPEHAEHVDRSVEDDASEKLAIEVRAGDVYEDDEESGALEVAAVSNVPALVGCDERLQAFLARVGPGFDALFIAEHTGVSNYDDLITYTETREDLNPLVEAGMTPLQRNKLFRAILKEREQPAY